MCKSFDDSIVSEASSSDKLDSIVMINHYLDKDILGVDIPDKSDAATTNSQTSWVFVSPFLIIPSLFGLTTWGFDRILANANACVANNNGNKPQFILLDWVDQGQAVAAANSLNGVS